MWKIGCETSVYFVYYWWTMCTDFIRQYVICSVWPSKQHICWTSEWLKRRTDGQTYDNVWMLYSSKLKTQHTMKWPAWTDSSPTVESRMVEVRHTLQGKPPRRTTQCRRKWHSPVTTSVWREARQNYHRLTHLDQCCSTEHLHLYDNTTHTYHTLIDTGTLSFNWHAKQVLLSNYNVLCLPLVMNEKFSSKIEHI